MTHGDNSGLVLPPHIAPIQVIVLPIAAHKPGVTEKAEELVARLKAAGLRAQGDHRRRQKLDTRRIHHQKKDHRVARPPVRIGARHGLHR